MNISYNWLKEYINLDIQPEKVAETLTSLGLEVGGMEEIQTVKGGLEGLVIGEVLTCHKHPNADKLSVTTVNVGQDEPLHIVCGAPNVAAGQKVVVATVGTLLYQGEESFTIKKSKIRGELSEGMICAEDEIGLGASHDGIMVLNDDAVIGTPAKEYFKIENDVVFEVDLTPNRIDSASHIGVARDLAASLKQTKPETQVIKPSVDGFSIDNRDFHVDVVVENSEACPRYSGVTISGIEVKESPDWLKNKLRAIGLSPINNVVDVTNFVLYECGQPLHAFDGNQIKGNKIVVKTLVQDTKFVTLDGKERQLSQQDLMICNDVEGMCMAGVFGGLESGVTPQTTKLFLESACFNPVYIRKTSKRHLLYTDASFRYERGTDPNITIYALKRAALLIKEVAGGSISSDIVDVYPNPVADFEVEIAFSNITRLIGKELGKDAILRILESLEIKVKEQTETTLKVLVPPYRVDVLREVDVIEEILRIYGYNNIEIPTAVHSTLVYSKKPDVHKLRNTIAEQLIGAGFQEIMSNSLTKAAYYDTLQAYPRQNTVELSNPLSNDLNGMRQTLLFNGLEAIQHNVNRRNADLKLFELGNCYYSNGTQKHELGNYSEEQHLGLFITGNESPANWYTPAKDTSFYSLKAHVNNVLLRLGINPADLTEGVKENDLFDDAMCYCDQNQKVLVWFGGVSSKLLKSFDISQPVYFAEFQWDLLMKKTAKQKTSFTELPKFPEVRRDLALLLDKSVTFAQIRDLAFKTEKKLLKKVSMFDVYEGEKLGSGKKSYAVTFVLRDDTKTLTDIQIDKIMQNLIATYELELAAQLR